MSVLNEISSNYVRHLQCNSIIGLWSNEIVWLKGYSFFSLILTMAWVIWQITPLTTFIMVLLALSPCLVKAWRNPQPRTITRWVAYAYMCGFLFGWHVHEKASLHFVIPLAIVAVQSIDDARHFFILSIGTFRLLACGILWFIGGAIWDLCFYRLLISINVHTVHLA